MGEFEDAEYIPALMAVLFPHPNQCIDKRGQTNHRPPMTRFMMSYSQSAAEDNHKFGFQPDRLI